MDKESLNKAKVNALAEKMRAAETQGTFEKDKSVFLMESIDLGLSEEQFNLMAEEAKHRSMNDKDAQSFMKRNKIPILVVFAIIVLLELLLPIGLGWKILIILLTLIICVVLLACLIVKHRKQ